MKAALAALALVTVLGACAGNVAQTAADGKTFTSGKIEQKQGANRLLYGPGSAFAKSRRGGPG
ncbi:MAG: hypothetical protein AAFV19_05260 [Pseudomonadota bacterium]